MPSVADRDHAGAIPHDEGAERRLGAADGRADHEDGQAQIIQFRAGIRGK
jgi:hypothetical protein